MKTRFLIAFFLLFTYLLIAQEEIISAKMDIKEFESTISIPIVDNENNFHVFSTSKNILTDQGIVHIKYDSKSNILTKNEYPKPPAISFKYITGISIDSENNISLYFHKKANKEFNRLVIKPNGEIKNESFKLFLKKEKIIHYSSSENNFKMLTVKRNESLINVYNFNGNSFKKTSFDFNQERFYDKETKLTNLDDLIPANYLHAVSNEIPNKVHIYGKKRKIYSDKNKIIITLNHHKNGTRILNLDLKENTAKADYIPLPRTLFKADDWTKSNSFIFNGNIYSIIASKKLMVINIKNLETKETLKEFIFDGEEELEFQLSKNLSSTLIVVPISINSSKTKITKGKTFFKRFILTPYSGISGRHSNNNLILTVGGYSPPTGGSMNFGAPTSSSFEGPNGPITISSNTHSFSNNSLASSSFEKSLVLNSNTFEIVENKEISDIYKMVEAYSENIKGIQLKSLFKYQDYFLFGYYNKNEKNYHLVKFND